MALLLDGQHEEGWREFEWRLAMPEFQRSDRNYAQPRWDGTPPGLTLLLTTEQGLGDALHFIRFASVVAAAGMRVIVHAQRPLWHLLATAPGVSSVTGPGEPLPLADAHLPLMSLPGALGIDEHALGGAAAYLSADPQQQGTVAARFAAKPGLLRVGLAWSGNPLHRNDRRRSIAFGHLLPLFGLREIEWYSLQKGPAALTAAPPRGCAWHPLPETSELDDTAALVAELDLVLSVDTAIAHLAGALGKAVWVMLPFAPDWRWGLGDTTTPWYATARLFRQPRLGDWPSTVEAVSQALAAHAAETAAQATA